MNGVYNVVHYQSNRRLMKSYFINEEIEHINYVKYELKKTEI